MNVVRIHHVGVVVQDSERAAETLQKGCGLLVLGVEERQGAARVALVQVGGTLLHLIQPLDDASIFARALRARGEGPHHLAVEVEDLTQAAAFLASRGIRLLDPRPRRDPGDAWAVFVDPACTGGILLELVQPILAGR